MHESFGARLRQRREERAIPLVTIADQTKIKLSLLEALERDDVSRWPSGIFRRAFVRSYAHAIGLDPDLVVREFLERYPDPEVEATALDAVAAASVLSHGPRNRLSYIVGSALDSLSRLRGSAPGEDQVAGSSPSSVSPERSAPRTLETPTLDALSQVSRVSSDLGSEVRRTRLTSSLNGGPDDGSPVAPSPASDRSAPLAPNGEPDDRVPAPAAAPAALAPEPPPVTAMPPRSERPIDFVAVAHLCTELGRVETAERLQQLLQEAAAILDAKGLIVWVWDGAASGLRPALAHGYPDRALAQLPVVSRDADNATAAAFRSGQACVTDGSDETNGALVTPLLTAAGCAGVLAIELPHGREQTAPVRAAATIFAALLSQLIGGPESAEVRPEVTVPAEALDRR